MSEAGAALSVDASGLRAATRRLVPIVVFGLLPAAALCLLLANSFGMSSRLAFWDFHAIWGAGRDVLNGHSPYPAPDPKVLAGQQAFVYPAPAAVAAAPLALLSFHVSSILFALLSVAALLLALRVAGVRDWRIYGIALVSRPVLHGIALGAVTPLLTLGLAVGWRWRARRWVVAGAVAAMVVLKVFLWPLLLWLAFTRRLAAAAIAAGLIVVVSVAGWAVTGLGELDGYPHLLTLLSRVLEGKGYSVVALGLSLGMTAGAARALAVVVGLGCLALVGWGGRGRETDQWTLTVAVAAAFAFSPIVWLHYFMLLLVPLAIASPRLGPLWALPLAFWVVGGQSTDAAIWDRGWTTDTSLSTRLVGGTGFIAYGLGVAALTLLLCALHASRRREAGLERPVRANRSGAGERTAVP